MSTGALIDCDVDLGLASIDPIVPFLAPGWREHLTTGGGLAGAGYRLPAAPYRPPETTLAIADAASVRVRLSQGGDPEVAVLNAGLAPALSGVPNVVMADAIARAANDWLVALCHETGDECHAAACISLRDSRLAVAELRRVAAESRVVAAVAAFPPVLLGDRSLRALHATLEELGLPLVLQVGGAFAGVNPGPAPVGHPTSFREYDQSSRFTAAAHVISLVNEGALERHPNLRVVFSGFGVGWLLPVLWCVDDRVGGGRRPGDAIRAQVRCSTRAVERPADVGHILGLLDLLAGKDLLVHATGKGGASDDGSWLLPWLHDGAGQVTHDNATQLLPRLTAHEVR